MGRLEARNRHPLPRNSFIVPLKIAESRAVEVHLRIAKDVAKCDYLCCFIK